MRGDLVITPYPPVLGSGRALRLWSTIKALAEHRPVEVVYADFDGSEPAADLAADPRITLTPVRPSRGPRRAAAYLGTRAQRVPRSFARAVSPELRRATELRQARSVRVIADGPAAAQLLSGLAARRPVVYLAHNLESMLRPALGEAGAAGVRGFERSLLSRVAESWMASRADLAGARQLAPAAALRYVPNVVDVASIRPRRAAAGKCALLVADFRYLPNRRAAEFLVAEVMPRVWQQLPQARLSLVGRGLDSEIARDQRVKAPGFVPALDSAYAQANAVVVPLLESGGSPLKFIEGLAYGLPVVATPRAAAGIDGQPGIHFLQAEGPEQFAHTLAEVLTGGAAEVAAAGRQLAEERYSLQALAECISPGGLARAGAEKSAA